MIITANHIFSYAKCPAVIYMNMHGDRRKRVPLSKFIEKKINGNGSNGQSCQDIIPHREDLKKISYCDLEEGFKKTLSLMKEGKDAIYNGVLIIREGDVKMIGIPDMLEKKKGGSVFGDYYYKPCDMKRVKIIKTPYRLQIAFYCYLLENIQGYYPEKASIINVQQNKIRFDTDELKDSVRGMIDGIKKIYSGDHPGVLMNNTCNECRWKEECTKKAEKEQDISLIFGMNSNAKAILNQAGIKKISQLSRVDPEVRLGEIPKRNIVVWKNQAESLIENKPIVLKHPKIRTAQTEIFFDIEGMTERSTDYLYGLLVRKNGREIYKGFFAKNRSEEIQVWKGFIDTLKGEKDYVIYHYAPYERISIRRMFERYGSSIPIEEIESNMVDIYSLLKESVVLPLYSYSLKTIANYIGFRWANKAANGTQSIIWYNRYMQTKNKKFRDLLIEYNKDDCVATRVVKDWLENLGSSKPKTI